MKIINFEVKPVSNKFITRERPIVRAMHGKPMHSASEDINSR